MNFKENDIIFLLGAGSSADAGVPVSSHMVNDIEEFIKNDEKWKGYKELYYCLKSSILYGDGIRGFFKEDVNYNIERLVNVLQELEKKEIHPIFPFIGQWNTKIIEITNYDFEMIKDFKKLIIEQLKKWITLDNYKKAFYFRNFRNFKNEYAYPLKIFTLNYDLCIERTLTDITIERGFNNERLWDYKKFIDNPERVGEVDIFLYKMHGSIDWERKKETGEITFSDEVSRIKKSDLIFGTDYKLQYIDPYLFFAYEFRKHTLDAKLIIVIGYGFGDEHINGILGQALKKDNSKKLLCVGPCIEREYIKDNLKIKDNSLLEIVKMKSKKYFESKLSIEKFKKLFPKDYEYFK